MLNLWDFSRLGHFTPPTPHPPALRNPGAPRLRVSEGWSFYLAMSRLQPSDLIEAWKPAPASVPSPSRIRVRTRVRGPERRFRFQRGLLSPRSPREPPLTMLGLDFPDCRIVLAPNLVRDGTSEEARPGAGKTLRQLRLPFLAPKNSKFEIRNPKSEITTRCEGISQTPGYLGS